jgi:amino-acid N-acetyltransferase
MEFRGAVKADWVGILELVSRFPEKLMLDDLPRSQSFCVAIEDKLVGCCAFVRYRQNLGEIRSLAVDESRRGRGLGKKLVSTCIERARNLGVKEILTSTDQVDLFQNLGFRYFHKEKYALIRDMSLPIVLPEEFREGFSGNIRRAAWSDWGMIKHLAKEHALTVYGKYLPKPQSFFVAEADRQVVGCMAYVKYRQRIGEVRSLAVEDGLDINAVSAQLIVRCLKQAKHPEHGVKKVLCSTSQIMLYESLGFSFHNKAKFAMILDLEAA